MSTVAASIVKDLRDQTNCPMLDCKQALIDAGGDFDGAKKLLRERLGNLDSTKPDSGTEGVIALVTVSYPAEKVEGLVVSQAIDPKLYELPNYVFYVIAEIGSETDFTANNPDFVFSCQKIVRDFDKRESILGELRSITGENITLRRHEAKMFKANENRFDIGSYVHHNRKMASVVVFDGLVSEEVKKSIAMHIVAVTPSPVCITPEEVPDNLVQTEREFFMKKAQGKPQNIQDKIVEGGLTKFKATLALNEQPLVMDPSKKVKDILPSGVKIVHFVCWKI